MLDVVLKRFDNPDEVRVFEKGKFELVKIAGMTIGRATYEPGWKWSEHPGPTRQCGVLYFGPEGFMNLAELITTNPEMCHGNLYSRFALSRRDDLLNC